MQGASKIEQSVEVDLRGTNMTAKKIEKELARIEREGAVNNDDWNFLANAEVLWIPDLMRNTEAPKGTSSIAWGKFDRRCNWLRGMLVRIQDSQNNFRKEV